MKKILLILLFIQAGLSAQDNLPNLIFPEDGQNYVQTRNLPLQWDETVLCNIQVSATNDFSQNTIILDTVLTGSTLFINGLSQSTDYYWRLRTDLNSDNWTETNMFTTTSNPVIPTLLQPENEMKRLADTVHFNWSDDLVNVEYEIQTASNSSFTSNLISAKTTDTSFSIPNFEFGHKYHWRVRSFNVDGLVSSWSNSSEFTIRLETPELLFPSQNYFRADTSITFQWLEVFDAPVYRFQLSKDSSFDENIIDTSFYRLGYKVDDLEYNQDYFWRVRVYNYNNNRSEWSGARRLKTAMRKPILEHPVNDTLIYTKDIKFNWIDKSDAESFQIQISDDSLFANKFIDERTDTNSFTADSLESNRKFFWRVIAINNEFEKSKWTEARSFRTMLETPKLLEPANRATLVSATPKFVWNETDFANSYSLQIADDSLFINNLKELTANTTTFTSDSLKKDHIYFWRVKALNDSNYSRWSKFRYFRTSPDVIIYPNKINEIINLSKIRTDTAKQILIANYGNQYYQSDSIIVEPSKYFYTDAKSLIVAPGSERTFNLLIKRDSISGAMYNGSIGFIRNFDNGIKDTTKINFNLDIKMSQLSVDTNFISFDTTAAQKVKYRYFKLGNNNSNIDLEIDSIVIIDDTTAFTFNKNFNSVSPGSERTMRIDFTPFEFGEITDTVMIYTNSYPDSVLELYLSGTGRGGFLSQNSLEQTSIKVQNKFGLFENNNRVIDLFNNGDEDFEYSISFNNGSFKLLKPHNYSGKIDAKNNKNFELIYDPANFDTLNIDTLSIYHNGFGENPLTFELKGGFDSLNAAKSIRNNLYVNNNRINSDELIFPENTPISFELDTEYLKDSDKLWLRLNYYTGGAGKLNSQTFDNKYQIKLSKNKANDKGLIFFCDLLTKDKSGNIKDSVIITNLTDIQIILKDYETETVPVLKSVPAEVPEKAVTKWALFGFPFEDAIADSVTSNLGGIREMKDGEWIIYEYEPSGEDSFSVFDDYYFEAGRSYFIAQSVMDTFKVAHKYHGYKRTRKLSDNTIHLVGSHLWNTTTSPFTFDVQADSTVQLYTYNPYRNSYKPTNIMEPGKGYFIAAQADSFTVKTFGKYDPMTYPQALSGLEWFVTLNFNNENFDRDIYFALSSGSLRKGAAERVVHYPPDPFSNVSIALKDSDNGTNISAAVAGNNSGKSWLLNVKTKRKTELMIQNILNGNMPNGFSYRVIDAKTNNIVENNKRIVFSANTDRTFKVILGTEEYINEETKNNDSKIPDVFALRQNYPNPFNPSTMIDYSIGTREYFELAVFNILGEKIMVLDSGIKEPGSYKISFDAGTLPSGIYFYRLKSKAKNIARKMILIK